MAIKGVVYLNQKVAAEDHAALFQMLISDGIISGCGVSSRLNVLTISEGMFIVAGRLTRILGSESITIPTTQSGGYARIKGVCDMGGAATRSTFGQFRFEVEYNVAIDGFNPLRRENINYGGQIYEVEWAILTLGESGNITNVDVKIGQSHGGGSGAVTEDDFSNYGTANTDYIFASSGDDWEVAFLTSNPSFVLDRSLDNVDIFLLNAGDNGGQGDTTSGHEYIGGNGGNGGRYKILLASTIPSGTYAVNIGHRGSEISTADAVTAFGSDASLTVSDNDAYAGEGGEGANEPNDFAPQNGEAGIYAFSEANSLIFPGRRYSCGGGGGGSDYYDPAYGSGGSGGSGGSPSVNYDGGGNGGNSGHPHGYQGGVNSGSGGGGGYTNGNAEFVGSYGGSGIIIIRNHRSASA